VAVASAGPYANHYSLAPDNHFSTSSLIFTGWNRWMLILTPCQHYQSTEGIGNDDTMAMISFHLCM